jgi:imidazolonepropionase-like amidohydrolase
VRFRLLKRFGVALSALLLVGLALVSGVGMLLAPPAVEVPAQARLTFDDMTIVNPGVGRLAGQRISIADGRIARIDTAGASDPRANPPGDDAARRLRTAFVLPGLIDMHVHYPPGRAASDVQLFNLLFLAHGVTTVRDTGDFDGSIPGIRERIRAGAIPGPRMFTCGILLDGDPPIWPGSRIVRTADDAEAAVADDAAQGVDCVKVYANLTPEALAAIRQAAARRGLPVIGHVSNWVAIESSGIADVQHLTGVAQAAPPPTWPNHDFRDWVSGVIGAWRNLDDARVEFVVQTALAQGTAFTPTIVVWDHIARLADYERERALPEAMLVPRYYRELMWNPGESFSLRHSPTSDFVELGKLIPKMRDVVLRLHRAGVKIYAGTDTLNPFVVPGVSLHEELRQLVAAGFTPEEAWVAATSLPGAFLREPMLGTLQAGAPADLLVFRKDPTQDLANLTTLEAVVAGGRLYPKQAIDDALARHRAHFESPAVDGLSTAIARMMLHQMARSAQ